MSNFIQFPFPETHFIPLFKRNAKWITLFYSVINLSFRIIFKAIVEGHYAPSTATIRYTFMSVFIITTRIRGQLALKSPFEILVRTG